MERRHVLAAMAVAVGFPTLARAQATSAAPSRTQPSPAASTNAPQAQAAPVGEAETAYMKQTAAIGSLSLALSRLAEKRLERMDAKQFATFEVAEQTTIANIFKSIQDPATFSGAVTPPTDAEVEAMLDDMAKENLKKLQQAKGRAFLRDYVMAEIDGHQKLLGIQEDYLKTGKNPEAVAVAKLARGMIKEHLALLSDIKDDMGRG